MMVHPPGRLVAGGKSQRDTVNKAGIEAQAGFLPAKAWVVPCRRLDVWCSRCLADIVRCRLSCVPINSSHSKDLISNLDLEGPI